MAKIRPTSLVQSISGKTCQHDDTYFATNKQTGKTYAIRRCMETDYEPTELQKQVVEKFVSKSKFASAWWRENKPSDSNKEGTLNYQILRKAFKAQHKVGNIFSYLSSCITEDMKVMVGTLDITGEVKNENEDQGNEYENENQNPGAGGGFVGE